MHPHPFLSITRFLGIVCFSVALLYGCLPPATPYPNRPPAEVVADAIAWSGDFEAYIEQWLAGQASPNVPNSLIPAGISDSKDFYLKNPDNVTPEETWAVRFAKPIDKDSLYAGIPDPKITYLFLGTALAPFGSKLVMEGEFPHARFFSIQITQPLNGSEYYAQRQFGAAEVALVDADIEPLPGHTNPYRVGADRNATQRKYRVEFDLTTGDPTQLNPQAHVYPYRKTGNQRTGSMLVYQGPLGYKTIAGTDLPVQGDWNLGALWIRIYEPDNGTDALGGVPMPKVWFELPNGQKYFVGSNFGELQKRADATIANRVVDEAPNPNFGPACGWFKSWEISRNILSGICLANGWSRPDSGARVRDIALGWTGRGEFQPSPSARIEPHATTNNYISYVGRALTVQPGQVAVLTGKLPTFPSTRNGEAVMQGGQVRYWSICGIDQDPLSPLPATTIHAISDDDVVLDNQRNYMIVYSRPGDRPSNAGSQNGVSWVDWGTQSSLGLITRWLCIGPEWNFPWSPHENHLSWATADWTGSQYDSTLIGVNWRNGFMQCYLPKVHYMSKAEFEALGNQLSAEKVPVWVDDSYKIGPSEAQLATMSASSFLDNLPANAVTNLNDGNFNTAWSSAFGQQSASVTADLGSEKTISAIKLFWDWIFYARDYTIEVSNDAQNWTTIATAVNENGQIDLYAHLSNIKGRYVRLNLTQNSLGYYRLGEFEIYTNDCDCEAPVSSSEPQSKRTLELNIWPNPTQHTAFVQWSTEEPTVIELRNLKGAIIATERSGNGRAQFELGHLPAGVYLVQARTGTRSSALKKVVKL
jgi:F5/8 type C domain/Secretion system C-terminal sorting domain